MKDREDCPLCGLAWGCLFSLPFYLLIAFGLYLAFWWHP